MPHFRVRSGAPTAGARTQHWQTTPPRSHIGVPSLRAPVLLTRGARPRGAPGQCRPAPARRRWARRGSCTTWHRGQSGLLSGTVLVPVITRIKPGQEHRRPALAAPAPAVHSPSSPAPPHLLSQNENSGWSSRPWSIMLWKGGTTFLTEISGKPMPCAWEGHSAHSAEQPKARAAPAMASQSALGCCGSSPEPWSHERY